MHSTLTISPPRAVASLKTTRGTRLEQWGTRMVSPHSHMMYTHVWVAAWRSGNVVGCIIKFTLGRAQLVLRGVTEFMGILSQVS